MILLAVLFIHSVSGTSFRAASLVEDEKRGHDDVSWLPRRIRIHAVEQAEVEDGVGLCFAHDQLEEPEDVL